MNSSTDSFTKLLVWQKGHKLVIDIYKETKTFPRTEIHSITNQMRRAAVSVTSNIAEGFNRQSNKEKVQFYYTALSSLTELQNQLLISRDVGYLRKEPFTLLAENTVEISKMLNGLIKSIKK